MNQDISQLLKEWPYNPSSNIRLIKINDVNVLEEARVCEPRLLVGVVVGRRITVTFALRRRRCRCGTLRRRCRCHTRRLVCS